MHKRQRQAGQLPHIDAWMSVQCAVKVHAASGDWSGNRCLCPESPHHTARSPSGTRLAKSQTQCASRVPVDACIDAGPREAVLVYQGGLVPRVEDALPGECPQSGGDSTVGGYTAGQKPGRPLQPFNANGYQHAISLQVFSSEFLMVTATSRRGGHGVPALGLRQQ